MARLISASISPLVFIRMLPPNGGQMNSLVPSVPKASMVRTSSFILPRDAGDERGGGSEHEEIRSRSRGPQAILKKFFDFGFVETRELLFSLDDHGPLKEVRIFKHQLDRLVFRRRLLLHVLV